MSRLIYRLRALFRSRQLDQELEEELHGHLAREVERHLAGGMSPREAEAAARRTFGNVTALKETARDSWIFPALEQGWKNLVFAARALIRRPAFTVTALISLTLGLGATALVLSVFNTLLLRPLPFVNPDRLVAIWPAQTFGNREIATLRTASRSYSEVASFSPGWLMPLTGVEPARLVNAAKVSGNFFAMLGVQPLLGRPFDLRAESVGEDALAVLGEGLWRQSFGADPGIVGKTIRLDSRSFTVVAVMPKGFGLIDNGADLWVPMAMDQAAFSWSSAVTLGVGRLRDGVAPTTATGELVRLAARMQQDFALPKEWLRQPAVVPLEDSLVGNVRQTLFVLLAAVSFLLLLAIINVANLVMVRILERGEELAVRASVGATSRQVAGLLLAEGMLLGVTGSAAGLLLARLGLTLLRTVLPASMPRQAEIRLDLAVVATVAGVGILLSLGTTLMALHQTRTLSLSRTLRGSRTMSGSGGRVRGLLVATEIALALVLTVGATLMLRTLQALQQVDRGLKSDHLLTMRLLPSNIASTERATYWTSVLAEVRAVPGVTSAATVLHLPMSGRNWKGNILVEGRDLPAGVAPPRAGWQAVSGDYFQVAGIPVRSGRPFGANDNADAPLVIAVNEALAAAIFPGENPVGRRISAGNATGGLPATIVAVVGNVRHDSLNAAAAPEVYVPFDQRPVGATSLIVRTKVDPASVAPAIRERITALSRDVPISDVRTMDDLYSASMQRPRMLLALLGSFAVVGLLLSAVGVYGVVAFSVRQRRREIGIRLALGGSIDSIRQLVVRQGLRYALLGIAVGAPLAYLLTQMMRGLVFGIPTSDPLSFAAVTGLLLIVAVVAAWGPARRATRTNPVEVLRQ